MATYLVIKNGNATKSYTCKDSANAPYIKVSNKYLPLTTNTTTGLKVKANGSEYSPLASYTTTTTTSYYSGTDSKTERVTLDNHSCSFKGYSRSSGTTTYSRSKQQFYTTKWYETIKQPPAIEYDGQEITSCSVFQTVSYYNSTLDANTSRGTSYASSISSRIASLSTRIVKSESNEFTTTLGEEQNTIVYYSRYGFNAPQGATASTTYGWSATKNSLSLFRRYSNFENDSVTLRYSTIRSMPTNSVASASSVVTEKNTLSYYFSQTKKYTSAESNATCSIPCTVTETITVE